MLVHDGDHAVREKRRAKVWTCGSPRIARKRRGERWPDRHPLAPENVDPLSDPQKEKSSGGTF